MTDPINFIANWLEGVLAGWGLSPALITLIMTLISIVVVCAFVLLIDIFLVWLERKFVARFQDRLGPNRLGPFGLIQPLADVIKLLIKEDTTPGGADRVVYNLAPIMALASVLLLWAVIPFSPTLIGADINVAVLYVVAVGAIGTLSIIMAGWSSNNKYALLGAFRMVAQMVSFEVPMVIALLVPVILARSMSLQEIVTQQDIWYVVMAPVAMLIFFITVIAELGRAPFDLVEAESEIATGFIVEYSGMKFGLFYAGELLHALTVSAMVAVLFLGGWRGWGVDALPLLGPFWLFLKTFLLYWAITWVKYTMPRIRIDHMLSFNWKFLTPLALVMVFVTALMDKLLVGVSSLGYALGMLVANGVVVWITLTILRAYASMERKRVGPDRPVASPELAEAPVSTERPSSAPSTQ
jgi:NADH-quinone oxidoreductase subunit H